MILKYNNNSSTNKINKNYDLYCSKCQDYTLCLISIKIFNVNVTH